MQQGRLLIGAGIVVAIGLGWYAFRPELLFVNESVSETFPGTTAAAKTHSEDSAPELLAEGRFHGVAHETRGEAKIYQLADGKRVVRFSDFETSNGPDVRVFLVAASDANDDDTVKNAGYIEVGKLKGNIGDQNYDVPAEADLAKYRSVTIWCNRFSVNFATAPLGPVDRMPQPVAAGRFHGVAHETRGMATVYRLADGKHVLRFSDFETSNGPDVRVFLVAADDANDNDTVKKAGFVELGKLKGNIGDQNYEVPGEVDLAKYRAVTIWCNRFGVNFATAPLTPAGA